MSNCVVYHNPRCSKSRQALELLDKKKVPYKIFYYLKEEPKSNKQISNATPVFIFALFYIAILVMISGIK